MPDERDIRPNLDELSQKLSENSRVNEDLKASMGLLNRSISAEFARASQAVQHSQRAPASEIHEALKPLRNIVEILALGADPLNRRYDTGLKSYDESRAKYRESFEALSGSEKTMRTLGHEFARMFLGFGFARAGRLPINAGDLAPVPRLDVSKEKNAAAKAFKAAEGFKAVQARRSQEIIDNALDAANTGLIDPKDIDNAFAAAGEIKEHAGRISRGLRARGERIRSEVKSALEAQRYKVAESLESVDELLDVAASANRRQLLSDAVNPLTGVGGGRAVVAAFNEIRDKLTEPGSENPTTPIASRESEFQILRQRPTSDAEQQLQAGVRQLRSLENREIEASTPRRKASLLDATQFYINQYKQRGDAYAKYVERAEMLADRLRVALSSVDAVQVAPRVTGLVESLQETLSDAGSRLRPADSPLARLGADAANLGRGAFVGFDELRARRDFILSESQAYKELLADRATTIEAAALKHEESTEALFRREAEAGKQGLREFEATSDARVLIAQNAARVIADGQRGLERLQDQAADAFSRRQLERVRHETAQAIEAYQKRYTALTSAQSQALVGEGASAQREYQQRVSDLSDQVRELSDLHGELGIRIGEAFQTERLEQFKDGLAGVLDNLAGITLSHLWDSVTDGVQQATDAVADFTTRAGDSIRLLQSDILRLERFNEDSDIRGSRLVEDRERRIQQLRRQEQALAARAPVGDQAALERNVQRRQDISFRIAQLREDFGVRIERQLEDAERRRGRIIEDSLTRRERFEARSGDESLLSKLSDSLASSVSSAISNAIAQSLADYLTKSAFDAGVGLITAALGGLGISSITDTLKSLFGGGKGESQTTTESQDTDTSTATGDVDVDGTIKTLTVDPDITKPTVDVTGTITSAMQAAAEAYTTPTINALGRITSAELSEGATLPSVPGLKGGVANVVLQNNVQLPLVSGLEGSITSLGLSEGEDAANPPSVALAGVISSFALDLEEGESAGSVAVAGLIKSASQASEGYTVPSVDVTGRIKSAVQATEGYTSPTIDAEGRITSAELSEGASLPSVPGLKGGISSVVLQNNAQLPLVPGLSASISSLVFNEDIDVPSIPAYEAIISDITFAEGVAPPALSDYAAVIASVGFVEGITIPSLPSYSAVIESVNFAEGIDLPSLPSFAGVIGSLAFAEGVSAPSLPNYDAIINSVKFAADIDLPDLSSYEALIGSLKLVEGIELPTVSGLAGQIDSVTLAADIDLPTIRIPATAVVGSAVGGLQQIKGTDTDEDPENPMLGGGLEGLINPLTIDPAAVLPTVTGLTGVITNIVLGPNVTLPTVQFPGVVGGQITTPPKQSDGGQPDPEDALNPAGSQYGTVAQNIQKIADATTELSGNLDPALGPTPRIDIPDILDKLNKQTDFTLGAAIDAGQKGFGEALRSANQFREKGGGAGGTAQSTAVRVTFPPEIFRELAQEATLQTGFSFSNEHLSNSVIAQKEASVQLLKLVTFTENGMFPALNTRLLEVAQETTLASIKSTLGAIEANTGLLTELPLITSLAGQGVSTEDARDSLNLGERQTDLLTLLQSAQDLAGPTPDLSQIAGVSESSPLFVVDTSRPEVQKVEVMNKVQTETEIKGTVNVKQVGVVQVSQSGEWVIQLASGATIPVYVQGGSVNAHFSRGEITELADAIDLENNNRAFNGTHIGDSNLREELDRLKGELHRQGVL